MRKRTIHSNTLLGGWRFLKWNNYFTRLHISSIKLAIHPYTDALTIRWWFLNWLFLIFFDFFTRYQQSTSFIYQSNWITCYSVSYQRNQLSFSNNESAGHAAPEKFDHKYTLGSFRDRIEDKFLSNAFAWMSKLRREIEG